MVVARESTPLPSWLMTLTRSQGIESASGEGALATALPVTRLPSLASQEGPAKCLPKGLPSLSKSWASGDFSVQVNWAASLLQVYTWSPFAWTWRRSCSLAGGWICCGTCCAATETERTVLAAASSVADANPRMLFRMEHFLLRGHSSDS